MSRPRVLVVTPDFPPALGGIQKLVFGLVTHWSRVETRVVTLAQGAAKRRDRVGPITVRRVAVPPGLPRRTAVAALNFAAVSEGLRFKPDVIVSGHVVVSPAARGLQRLKRVPVLQYLYGSEITRRAGLARFAVRSADAVVALSRYSEQLALAAGARPERVARIPPGVDSLSDGACGTDPLPDADPPTILVISRLDERYKGHDVLIRALPLVRARLPEVRLEVIGDGIFRLFYEALATALGVRESLTFRGAVDEDAKRDALQRAQVFAMPSRIAADGGGEGFGIVFLEAGLYGLPVVAGALGGSADAVVNEQTGVLVDATDHIAVAEAISDLLAHPERAKEMGRLGARRAHAHSWPAIARQVEDLLLELAASR